MFFLRCERHIFRYIISYILLHTFLLLLFQYGLTALIVAAGCGQLEVCSMLLDRGANIEAKTKVSENDRIVAELGYVSNYSSKNRVLRCSQVVCFEYS
jgi:hypothetical protein